MLTSPANQRRRQKSRRRNQIRRRRVVALVVLVTLISLAIWVAYAIPGQTPARVPEGAAQPAVGRSVEPDKAVVVAQIEGVDVLLPVAQEVSTAVAFHPVDNPDAVGFSPIGERLGGGHLGQKLADIFAGGGDMQYYLMGGSELQDSPATAGLDVGAIPGSPVLSPVDGKVTGIKEYKVLGRYRDYQIDITLAADPSLLLIVTHVADPRVDIGAVVLRGSTVVGVVRGFPAALKQSISQYTSDNGDHVQMTVVRVTPELEGL
jgi:hypothetical protein